MVSIYKKEMRAFLITPMGYAFMAAFLVVMNLMFYLSNVLRSYADITVLFPIILIVIMVLIPTLTMKLFSEEFKLKTDQMFMIAPVSLWDIVIGKFLAALSIFILALLGTITWPLIIIMFSKLNSAAVVGSYLAVLIAGAAFIALGLFISSLTESQIIAAILTFASFLAIYLLDSASTYYIRISWVKAVISWFSLFSRYDTIARGIFSLADITYYLSFTAIFLHLTTRVLQQKRWS